MKYIIELENKAFRQADSISVNFDEPLYRVKGFKSLVFDQNGLDKLTPYDPDEEYKRGLNDAWTFAEHLVYVSDDVTNSVYQSMNGGKGLLVAFGMPYEDAKKIYDEYFERKKKAEKEFKVGDEVIQITNSGTPTGTSCVVTYVDNEKCALSGINDNGKAVVCTTQMHRWWRKTGRSFSEIVEVLKKMGKEEA